MNFGPDAGQNRGTVPKRKELALAMQGSMYVRGSCDRDRHQWSFIHMDMSAIRAG